MRYVKLFDNYDNNKHMSKEELVKLAEKKGFRSQVIGSKPYFKDKPWLSPEKEELRYFLWVCELGKWLLDNHNMDIFSTKHTFSDKNFSKNDWFIDILINNLETLPDINK